MTISNSCNLLSHCVLAHIFCIGNQKLTTLPARKEHDPSPPNLTPKNALTGCVILPPTGDQGLQLGQQKQKTPTLPKGVRQSINRTKRFKGGTWGIKISSKLLRNYRNDEDQFKAETTKTQSRRTNRQPENKPALLNCIVFSLIKECLKRNEMIYPLNQQRFSKGKGKEQLRSSFKKVSPTNEL